MSNIYLDTKLPRIYNTLSPNLKAMYDFSESQGGIITDKSGNNNHGILYPGANGNSVNDIRSIDKTSVNLDGVDDYIQSTGIVTLDSFTIETWIETGTLDRIQGLITVSDNNSKRREIYVRNNKLCIIPYLDNRVYITADDVLSPNTIYHIVGVSNGIDSFKFYINGLEVNTFKATSKELLYDYNVWAVGQSGTIAPFKAEGNLPQTRIEATGPFGENAVVWKTYDNVGVYPGQYGGIYGFSKSIDNTKTYRMSWWERRHVNGDVYGRHLFGLNAYGSVNGVKLLSNDVIDTNPYFASYYSNNSLNTSGKWCIGVGHVRPYDHIGTANHIDSGVYQNGIKLVTMTNYRWLPETTTAFSRSLILYCSATVGATHYSVYPRVDVCDGTEPSLQDMLNGYDITNNTYINELGSPTTSNIIRVGNLDLSSNYYSNFKIFKVAIYDKALNSNDIIKLYNYESRFINVDAPTRFINSNKLAVISNNLSLDKDDFIEDRYIYGKLNSSNIDTIVVDDVVFILPDRSIIKAISNSDYIDYKIGIVKEINGNIYTIQINGEYTHSQTLDGYEREVYALTNGNDCNLTDIAPLGSDFLNIEIGKKISPTTFKISPIIKIPDMPINGLVGEWLMNGNALDTSGYGNNGVVTGATLTTDRFGRANKAYSLTDTNIIDIPYQSVVNITDDFTVSFWYKRSVVTTGHKDIFVNQYTTTSFVLFQIYTQINRLIYVIYDGTTYRRITYDIIMDTWNHIVLQQSAGVMFLRVNNINITQDIVEQSFVPNALNNNTTKIKSSGVNINYIDNFRIYNRALSQDEITRLYKK